MFANRFLLTLRGRESETPVPKAWLDQFFMRNFTGYSAFDETLASGDGLLEAGHSVTLHDIQTRFETWLRGRKMIAPEMELRVEEANQTPGSQPPQT